MTRKEAIRQSIFNRILNPNQCVTQNQNNADNLPRSTLRGIATLGHGDDHDDAEDRHSDDDHYHAAE